MLDFCHIAEPGGFAATITLSVRAPIYRTPGANCVKQREAETECEWSGRVAAVDFSAGWAVAGGT
jgi:hypothetical protein